MSIIQQWFRLPRILRQRKFIIWLSLTGLSTGLSFWLTICLSPVEAQALLPTATDAYYTLQPGEGLAEVALRFGLDGRTVRCANPDWKPGQSRVVVPLTAALRHPLAPTHNQTLAEIAQLYQVEVGVITDFPLNYWGGCPGEAAMGGQQPSDRPAAGTMLYIPVGPSAPTAPKLPANANPNNLLPAGTQAQVDPYMAEDDPQAALVNPYPLPFKLPESASNPNSEAILRPIRPAENVLQPVNPPKTTVAAVTTRPANKPAPTSPPVPTIAPTARPTQGVTTQVAVNPGPTNTPLAVSPPPAAGKPLIWPIRGVITTYFSASHPAIDIATKAGTPILAAQSGRVYYATWSPYGYGNFVQIDHGDGRQTHYAHLVSFAVQVGQQVAQGQVIGYEGSTGHSTGPHLHFELVIAGRYVNPLQYLGP